MNMKDPRSTIFQENLSIGEGSEKRRMVSHITPSKLGITTVLIQISSILQFSIQSSFVIAHQHPWCVSFGPEHLSVVMRISLKCPIHLWIITSKGIVTVATWASMSLVAVEPLRTTSTFRLPLPIGIAPIVWALSSVSGQRLCIACTGSLFLRPQ